MEAAAVAAAAAGAAGAAALVAGAALVVAAPAVVAALADGVAVAAGLEDAAAVAAVAVTEAHPLASSLCVLILARWWLHFFLRPRRLYSCSSPSPDPCSLSSCCAVAPLPRSVVAPRPDGAPDLGCEGIHQGPSVCVLPFTSSPSHIVSRTDSFATPQACKPWKLGN